jgi:hypothetical protein
VADRGRLTRYGGYWENKIFRVDQNQHHCFAEKGDLQRLGEETPTEINVYLPSLMMKVPDHLYVLGDTYTCHT